MEFPIEDELIVEPDNWEAGISDEICICGVPSTEDIVECCGPSCAIGWFHRKCVAYPVPPAPDDVGGSASGSATGPGCGKRKQAQDHSWVCELCSTELPSGNSSISQSSSTDASLAGVSASVLTRGPKSVKRATRAKLGIPHKTREEIVSQAVYMGRNAVQDLLKDEFYLDSPLGLAAIEVARKVDLESDVFEATMKTIVNDMIDILISAKDKFAGPSANTHIMTEFHVYRSSETASVTLQKLILHDCSEIAQSYFKQYVLKFLLEKTLSICKKDDDVDVAAPLSSHEEQVLRYVAGYVPHALSKKYGKMNTASARKISAVLHEWKRDDDEHTEAESFLQYTAVWLTIQNRGGLFLVTDDVYMLFRAMEIVTRKFLNVSCMQQKGEAMKDSIVKNIYGSQHVQRQWTKVNMDIDSKEADALFGSVVNYWVKIRVSAYVRSYVSLRKREQGKTKKSKKALRKSLKQGVSV